MNRLKRGNGFLGDGMDYFHPLSCKGWLQGGTRIVATSKVQMKWGEANMQAREGEN